VGEKSDEGETGIYGLGIQTCEARRKEEHEESRVSTRSLLLRWRVQNRVRRVKNDGREMLASGDHIGAAIGQARRLSIGPRDHDKQNKEERHEVRSPTGWKGHLSTTQGARSLQTALTGELDPTV